MLHRNMYWLLYILDLRFVLFLCTTAVWQFAINEYVMLCYKRIALAHPLPDLYELFKDCRELCAKSWFKFRERRSRNSRDMEIFIWGRQNIKRLIAAKLCVGPQTFSICKTELYVLYHHAQLVGLGIRTPPRQPKCWVFVCLSVCLSVCPSRSRPAEIERTTLTMQNALELRSGFDVVVGSHARTVVRECCKGDDESQWERVKFDPPPPKNPLTDGHQNLRT